MIIKAIFTFVAARLMGAFMPLYLLSGAAFLSVAILLGQRKSACADAAKGVPLSVNYHFTRRCNYQCGFCFHTAKTSFVLPQEQQMYGLKLLAKAGMRKVNFSGGEPFLEDRGDRVG